MYVLWIVVCSFVLFLLAIVLSVLLRYTDSDCPFGIFKLVLCVIKYIRLLMTIIWLWFFRITCCECCWFSWSYWSNTWLENILHFNTIQYKQWINIIFSVYEYGVWKVIIVSIKNANELPLYYFINKNVSLVKWNSVDSVVNSWRIVYYS